MCPKPENQAAYSQDAHIPKISIGMPVYNGEKYIREALDSLLAQTYADFELVISDNASTDGTEAICREYVNKDIRIKYIRQPINIGAYNNFNYLLENARGDYIKWLAHDDYLEPFFLEMMVKYLDEHDDVVLCTSDVKIIDDARQVLGVKCLESIRDHKDWRVNRRKVLSFSDHMSCTTCLAVYGVYRLSTMRVHDIRAIHGWRNLALGGDYRLLNQVALAGKMVALPSVQMTYRAHNESLGHTEIANISFVRCYANHVYCLVGAVRLVLFSRLDIREKVSILSILVFFDFPMIFVRFFKMLVIKLIGLNAARKLKYTVLRPFRKPGKSGLGH